MARISSDRSRKKYEKNKAARKKRIAEQEAKGDVNTSPDALSTMSRSEAQLALSTSSRLEGRVAKKRFVEQVHKNVDRLFAAQLTLALGSVQLFRVKEFKNGRKETELVTDVQEIIRYLNDPEDYSNQNDDDTYYLFTTKDPENKSIDSLLNRALGAPKQELTINDESGIFVKDRLRIEVVQPIDLNIDVPEAEVIDVTPEEPDLLAPADEAPDSGEIPLTDINNMARTVTLQTPPEQQTVDTKTIESVMKPSGSPGIKISRL